MLDIERFSSRLCQILRTFDILAFGAYRCMHVRIHSTFLGRFVRMLVLRAIAWGVLEAQFGAVGANVSPQSALGDASDGGRNLEPYARSLQPSFVRALG